MCPLCSVRFKRFTHSNLHIIKNVYLDYFRCCRCRCRRRRQTKAKWKFSNVDSNLKRNCPHNVYAPYVFEKLVFHVNFYPMRTFNVSIFGSVISYFTANSSFFKFIAQFRALRIVSFSSLLFYSLFIPVAAKQIGTSWNYWHVYCRIIRIAQKLVPRRTHEYWSFR